MLNPSRALRTSFWASWWVALAALGGPSSVGGTTTPTTITFSTGAQLTVSHEQVWAWDYIESFEVANFGSQALHTLFPIGAGGGVSIQFPVPYYQRGEPGIRTTAPGQRIILDDGAGSGPQDLLDLPAHFAGRNVPDISGNADPESGYLVQSTGYDPGAGLGVLDIANLAAAIERER